MRSTKLVSVTPVIMELLILASLYIGPHTAGIPQQTNQVTASILHVLTSFQHHRINLSLSQSPRQYFLSYAMTYRKLSYNIMECFSRMW